MAFELRSTLFEDDPYPRMKHFRENDPVHYAGEHQGWYLFRHADALELLHDERFSSEQGWPDLSKVPELLRPMMEMRPRWMLNRDAPEHTRLRKPVARAFSPRRAEQLSPRFRAIAEDLTVSCGSSSTFNAMGSYALPLVRTAMAEIGGVPEESRARFSHLVSEQESTTNTREAIERNASAVTELGTFFDELLRERREAPIDDYLSLVASLEPEALSWQERIATCVLVISAGAGVTVGAIGNALRALLEHPSELARFRDGDVDPDDAVDELLRFDPTAVALVRVAKRDTNAFGVKVAKGEKVTAVLGAANRDPEAFEDPERLDLARQPRHHLSFGHGEHYCIGASLARAQVRIALEVLLSSRPGLVRAPSPLVWRGGLQRVLASLPVRA